jgi:transcriptional regulator with XRE-family HTH domain
VTDTQSPQTRSQTVAANVRILLKQRRWSQEALAEKMAATSTPMHRVVVAKLMTGKRETVTVDELYNLAEVFGITADQLVTPSCDTCHGCPPPGYTCNTCGTGTEVA